MRVPIRSSRGSRGSRVASSLALLLLVGATLPSAVAAATVEDLVARATNPSGWAMSCTTGVGQVTCSRVPRIGPRWQMQVKPATGPIDSVDTRSQPGALPLDSASVAWMTDMHQFACGSPKAMDAFVSEVGTFTKPGTEIRQAIGTCSVTGGLYGGDLAPAVYRVVSDQLAQPTPAPTATPGPTGTPRLSATAGASTPPSAAPSPTPHPSAGTSAAPSATSGTPAAASASPSVEPSDLPGAAPPGEPSPVVGAVETGSPGTAPPAAPSAGAGDPPATTPPTFDQSVLGVSDVNIDGGAIAGSLMLVLLMLLMIGFAGELFNNTVENNYSEISNWFRKRPLRWLREAGGRLFGEARIGLVAFLFLSALISSFVDPNFGFDLRSLAELLGFFVGLVVVLASFKLPPMLAHRRTTGELGKLRPLPWALVIAIVFVLVSRIANLQPGYLYGIVLGVLFVKEVSPRDEGRETFYGALWTLGAALIGWLGLTWLRGLGLDPDGFATTLLATACAAIMVAGLEATAFGLMPLQFMPGYAVYRWNRLGWAVLWGLSLFGFLHVLIAPTSGYVSQLSPEAFAAALGVFAAFGALSIAVWAYFRFRGPVAAPVEVRFD